ncbi:ABC transporter permease [Embleya sp. AB8]|uniref:ABC transporter permease n=1 Tax=Embleya sp. AB8 TaxID=3156304 RepID=UPI003C77C23D
MSALETAAAPAPDTAEEAAPVAAAKTRKRRGFLLWFAIVWMGLVLLGALLSLVAPGVFPHEYGKAFGEAKQSPFSAWPEFLGTDGLGRSHLTRLAFGARVSMIVALVSVVVGVLVGGLLGLVAAYFRGVAELVIDLFSDALLAFPPLILLLALSSVYEPSQTSITAGLAVLTIPGFTRLTKASAIAQSNREYVTVAKAMGAGPGRIIFKELLPNTFPAVMSYSVIVMAVLIVAEGSLSFLGLSIPPPMPSWGGMINSAKDDLSLYPSQVFVPCGVLFLTVFSLNVIGDRLRAKFDVRDTKL